MPCLLLVVQVMDKRKVKYMVVNDGAAAWSESAPYFLFSPTGTKQELQEALLAKLEHQGRAALFLQDSDGDFAYWDEPIALPTSGTARVKVVLSTGILFKILMSSAQSPTASDFKRSDYSYCVCVAQQVCFGF